MKTIFTTLISLIISSLIMAQTVRSVSWTLTNFDEDEGVILVGKATEEVQGSDDNEFMYTDNNSDFIRIEIDQDLDNPTLGTTITIGGIMDLDDNVKEIDVKYWHTGDNSIVEELGLKTVNWLNNNAQDDMPFAVVGQFIVFAPDDWKYIFEDNTGSLTIQIQQNSFVPDFNEDFLCIGVINKWDIFTDYYVFFKELYTVTDIDENKTRNEVSVYPNPAVNYFSINCERNYTSVKIFDMTGKLISTMQADNGKVYDVSNMISGMYYVTVINEEEIIQTMKLVKN